jgi:hypothetical protein
LFKASGFFSFSHLSDLRLFLLDALLFLSFSFAGKGLLFFTFDEGSDFVFFFTFNDFLSLFFITRCFTFLFGASFFDSLFNGSLGFFDFLFFFFFKVGEEFVVTVSDKVEAARFSVTLAKSSQGSHGFVLSLEAVRTFKMETVFFTDQFSEEHEEVFLTAICFSVDFETAIHFFVLPMGTLRNFGHFLHSSF